MQQYRILYRRAGAEKWGTLEPGVHASVYAVPAVDTAIELIQRPEVEAVCVRHEGDLFNIIRFEQEALAPYAFPLTRS